MRAKISFSVVTKAFVASKKNSRIVEIYQRKNVAVMEKEYEKDTPLKVKLVRINLPSGETEVLITSLLNGRKYTNGIFKELYFKRWKVETFYD